MSGALQGSDPILSCEAAQAWEATLLADEAASWRAMQQVGKELAKAVRSDFSMTRWPQSDWRVLVLAGKGHNGGDALLAIGELMKSEGQVAAVDIVLCANEESLKENTRKALEPLKEDPRVTLWQPGEETAEEWVAWLGTELEGAEFELCIDGMLGMQFRPPLRGMVRALVDWANALDSVRFRVAVDLPSGCGGESEGSCFWADVTYATGILKKPLLGERNAGVLRYLDVGFFSESGEGTTRVLTDRILDPLRAWRTAASEKRRFGHVAILAGSRTMPGALSMCVQAALRSGVGLVTVLAPESSVSLLASQLPEAMWRLWPETPEGGLALEGVWQIRALREMADALVMGPGMGKEMETRAMMREVACEWDKPVVLDADALQPDVVDAFLAAGNERVVVTPHDGEFARIAGEGVKSNDEGWRTYEAEKGLCLVKKGSATRICAGGQLWVNTTGNGVLSRGGSGDLLAGLMGGLLARDWEDVAQPAAMAVYWHGKAADLLAVERGQEAVRTTELLDFLSPALQGGEVWNLNSRGPRRIGS